MVGPAVVGEEVAIQPWQSSGRLQGCGIRKRQTFCNAAAESAYERHKGCLQEMGQFFQAPCQLRIGHVQKAPILQSWWDDHNGAHHIIHIYQCIGSPCSHCLNSLILMATDFGLVDHTLLLLLHLSFCCRGPVRPPTSLLAARKDDRGHDD